MKNTLALTAVLLFLVFSFNVVAQEETTPEPAAAPATERFALEQADRDRPVMTDITITKKITGRLPSGYKAVITSTQRDEIYKVQKEYNELIELLKLRIELMEKERDHRVDALLDAEQVEKLRQTRGSLESEKEKKKPAAKKPKKISSIDE